MRRIVAPLTHEAATAPDPSAKGTFSTLGLEMRDTEVAVKGFGGANNMQMMSLVFHVMSAYVLCQGLAVSLPYTGYICTGYMLSTKLKLCLRVIYLFVRAPLNLQGCPLPSPHIRIHARTNAT
jgi:hypothetical protein